MNAQRRPLFVTDCEGPLTRNDNAAELAAAFIPDGAEFFARVSRYDDYLADVLRKPGYNAGNTLALIAPFLRAFGLGDEALEAFSLETLVVVPGAAELVAGLRELLPVFVISTSYTPYVRAVATVLGLPFDHCVCTELHLDDCDLPAAEAAWLRKASLRITEHPLLVLPDGATGIDDLAAPDRATVRQLDAFFWSELGRRAPVAAALVRSVHPVGGHGKLAALQTIAATAGSLSGSAHSGADMSQVGAAATRRAAHAAGAGASSLADVMYVGDSITDVPALAAVKEQGGIALSFNGNSYALAAAELAAASLDTRPTLELARAFARRGAAAARALARAWPASSNASGLPQVGLLSEAGAELAEASRAARASVRGEHIARLG
jgi:energy-converting hydrogenase A subunit R